MDSHQVDQGSVPDQWYINQPTRAQQLLRWATVPKQSGGADVPLSVGELGPHLIQSPWPTSIPSGISIHPAIWPQQIWAKNWEGAVRAPLGEGELDPHLTQCGQGRGLHVKSHLDPSHFLSTIHQRYRPDRQTGQADWTDRQTGRQDNGPIA